MDFKKSLSNLIKNVFPNKLLIHRGLSKCNCIALTFDDGPCPENTEKILKILRKYNVKATFFMNGTTIEQNKELFVKVISEGHEIGNHFYNHKSVTDLTYRDMKKEIEDFWETLKRIFPENSFPRIIRPPYGKVDLKMLWCAWRNKWTIVLWSLDTHDGSGISFQENIKMIGTMPVRGGDIVLLHEDAKYIDRLLEWIIYRISLKNFTFVKASELLLQI